MSPQPPYGNYPLPPGGRGYPPPNRPYPAQERRDWPYPAVPPPGYTPQAFSGYVDIPGLGHARVASIGQRLLARAIDAVVVFAVFGVICLLALALLIGQNAESANAASRNGTPGLGIAAGLMFLVALVFSWNYDAFMTGKFGATLGKSAVGIKVVDQNSGRVIGLARATIRNLIPFIGGLIFGVGALVVYASPLFDSSGRLQGWHDKAANDLVIKARPRLPR